MEPNEQEQIEQRKFFIIFLTVCAFLIIGYRFFTVQITGREEYYLRSEENRIRPVTEYPIRGLMYDRNMNLLVDNVPAYSILVIPYELKDKAKFQTFISDYFPEKSVDVTRRIRNAKTRYQATKIIQVNYDDLTIFEENIADLPGVMTQIDPQRYYPSTIRASHFLGYIKEIDEYEIKSIGEDFYQPGDIIGKKGIERQYEKFLRGEKGYKFLEVNALGQVIGEIITDNTTASVNGQNLVLTLDIELQQLAEELLSEKNGAVIALNPQNGEIYIAVSKPDYDPLLMSGQLTREQANELYNNPNTPLFNRATQSVFPPGSTFKIIGVITALNDSVLSPEKEYTCSGSYRLGRAIKSCWNKDGHGTLNMVEAIEQSCNVYFYNLSRELTINQWAKYAEIFGFGINTGIDIPEENPGILPTSKFMDKKIGKNMWHPVGTMVNLIIGQGELLVTPLQMARFAAIIGTKGKVAQPHFLKYVVDSYTDSITVNPVFEQSFIENIRNDVWDVVREGMRRVVNGEKGTARSVRMNDIIVSGKTGTSENPHGEDHAWFIGYAPEEEPTIAIAVFVENGGGGGRVAAPIAGRIIREYFELLKNRRIKSIITQNR